MRDLTELFDTCTEIIQEDVLDSLTDSELMTLLEECNDKVQIENIHEALSYTVPVSYV